MTEAPLHLAFKGGAGTFGAQRRQRRGPATEKASSSSRLGQEAEEARHKVPCVGVSGRGGAVEGPPAFVARERVEEGVCERRPVFALDEKSTSFDSEAVDFEHADQAREPPAPPTMGCSNDIVPEVNLLL